MLNELAAAMDGLGSATGREAAAAVAPPADAATDPFDLGDGASYVERTLVDLRARHGIDLRPEEAPPAVVAPVPVAALASARLDEAIVTGAARGGDGDEAAAGEDLVDAILARVRDRSGLAAPFGGEVGFAAEVEDSRDLEAALAAVRKRHGLPAPPPALED